MLKSNPIYRTIRVWEARYNHYVKEAESAFRNGDKEGAKLFFARADTCIAEIDKLLEELN